MSLNMNPNRIKLKMKASSDKADRDYDPTVQDVRIEQENPHKRKQQSSSIKLVNPNAPNKRAKKSEEIHSLLDKAKKIEATAAEIEKIESQLALIDRQLHITKSPSLKLVTRTPLSNSKRQRSRSSKKNYDDDELEDDELIDEDDDDPYYRKETKLSDYGNNFEESSLTDDDVDYDLSYSGGVATNRSKRPPKPSQKYPDHVKSRDARRQERAERQRAREQAAQLESANSVVVTGTSPAVVTSAPTSAPTPTRFRGKTKKPLLDVPFWKPIKAKPNTSTPEAMAQCKKVLQVCLFFFRYFSFPHIY